jgi:hypothetical protein
VGGVGAQQGVQQIAGEGGGEGRVAVEFQAVDHGLGGVGVGGVDVVGGQIALLDRRPQAGQAVDLLQGLRLGVRQPVAEGVAHRLDLLVHRGLRLAVGGDAGPGAGLGGLEPHGQQDRLLVLGVHPVGQLRDLGAVPHQPGRGGRVPGLADLVGEEIRQQHGDHGERDADQHVELAPERPAVGEAP